MKSILTLIKYHKQQLDALRRELAGLETQKSRLLLAIDGLRQELARELEIAGKNSEMSQFFGGFSQRIQEREELIRAEIAKLDAQMTELRERIREKFGELKTFEIARDQFIEREKKKLATREALALDEVAIQQFVRKEES